MVRLHVYPFEGRGFLRFASLSVRVLGQMRRAHELDLVIADSASKIRSIEGELTASKKNDKLGIERNRKLIELRNYVRIFCKNVRDELKEFRNADVDDYTILVREAKYLRKLAKGLKSKKKSPKVKATTRRKIEEEMDSLERKAGSLELIAKYFEKGGFSNVAVSNVNILGNTWVERLIKIKAIEINALHKRMERDPPEQLFKDFEKEAKDTYNLGKDVGVLVRRLKSTFGSIKTSLDQIGVKFPELERTQRSLERGIKGMGKMGKLLVIQMRGYDKKLKKEINKAEKDSQAEERRIVKIGGTGKLAA